MRLAALSLIPILALVSPAVAATAHTTPEMRTAAAFDRIAASPPQLRVFLQAMPKGGDLHNHPSGAIYAEDFLHWADAENLCIATDTARVVPPPCDAANRTPARGLATRDYPLYSRMINALSTRGFEQGVGDPTVSGYDRFFATFGAFGAAARNNWGKIIAATREAAAFNAVSYLEMNTLPSAAQELVKPAMTVPGDGTDFAALYAALEPLLPATVAHARAEFDGYITDADTLQDCKTQKPDPACAVEMRFQTSAGRTQPPAVVFSALALGFALAEADPRFVGVNIVAPEHDPVSVRDYDLHMRMFAWLKARHPKVLLSLHAGELTLGLVAPRDLRFHIQEAVAVAGAKRIGHGVDISYEADAPALLQRMAREKIAVEINLTSNAVILGVKGKDHPLALYRSAGVPTVLATDDEGVSRSDMTNEYMRGVTEQGLKYRDLKTMARNSLEYSFLTGPSLWQGAVGGPRVAACIKAEDAGCIQFLDGSDKARLQWRLEQDFAKFEATHP